MTGPEGGGGVFARLISSKVRPHTGGRCSTDHRSPGSYKCGDEEFVRVVRRAASVSALTDFGGTGRGKPKFGVLSAWLLALWIRLCDCWPGRRVCPAGLGCKAGTMMPGAVGTMSRLSLTLLAHMGRCPCLTLNLLARMGRCPRLPLTLLARVGRCPRLTLLVLLARSGCCPRLTLTLLAHMGRCLTLNLLAPYGTLSPSASVGPVGLYGMLSPSDSGPDGTLSTSDLAGILIPAVLIGIPFPVDPVGPVGTSSPSDLDSDGPVGKPSPFDHGDQPSPFAPPVDEMSSMDPAREPPGRLIPVIGTDCMASNDSVITQLPADGPVGDNRDVVDMDVTVSNCPVAMDVSDSCAMVAMVGPDTVQRREEAPMDCDDECAEWDIRNKFETIDGMPVYYGGDLCDSDGSEWDDPWDLAYAEYVDQYNFDAPEGMELKVFQRLKTVNEQAMMVSEVPGPRHVSPNLSGSLLGADMVDSETAVDILTEGHDVSRVAESPIQQAPGVTDGDGVAFCYEGDLGDSDCGSTGDLERDTWEDWCDSAFHNGYGGFPPDDPQPPVMFSNQLFWDDAIAEPSQMWPDGENAPVSTSPVLAGTLMPLIPPDTDRTFRLNNTYSELELLDSQIDEFSVLSLGTGDIFMDMDALDGDALGACTRYVGILDGDEGWLCLLYSASSGNSWDTSVAVGLDCKGLGHCRGIAWDPGPVGGRCLHVCCDCLCVIALFRDVMLLVHDWAALSLGSGIAKQMPGK